MMSQITKQSLEKAAENMIQFFFIVLCCVMLLGNSGFTALAAGGGQHEGENGVENSSRAATSSNADFVVSSYEVYAKNGSSKQKDNVKKGERVKVVVNMESRTNITGSTVPSSIQIIKNKDNFRLSGSAKVKITSKKDENLAFQVTFPDLTYSGRGKKLEFIAGFAKQSASRETMSINIDECEERWSNQSSGGGSDDDEKQPAIFIKRADIMEPVGAGEKFTVVVQLQNLSNDYDLENLIVSFDPGDSLYLLEQTNYRHIKQLSTGQTKEIKLEMQAAKDLTGLSKTLGVDVKYNYETSSRTAQGTASQKLLIPTKESDQSGQPIIRIDRSEMRPINGDEAFSVTLNIQNLSPDKPVRNLIASIEPTESISLLESTDSVIIGDLNPGEPRAVTLRLKAGQEVTAASQLIGINLKFDYETVKGMTQGTTSQKIVILTNASSGKKIGSATPNIIISKYEYGGQVAAGQAFDLNLEFTNTSKELPVENIVLTLETGEGLSITSSSNTFYIPKMDAGGNRKESIKVQALYQMKIESPKITVGFKYEYVDKNDRKQALANEAIAIPVFQPDRFTVRQPSFQEEIKKNEETTISIPYVNKGKIELSNVEAQLEKPEGSLEILEQYLNLGNFEAGKNGTIDFIVTPKKTGEIKTKVLITYETPTMQLKTVEVPITFTAKEESVIPSDNIGSDMTGNQESKPLIVWILGGGGLLTILSIAGAIIRKKKKAKGQKDIEIKAEDMEADWLDEDAEGAEKEELDP